MELKQYSTFQEFREKVSPFLELYEAENNWSLMFIEEQLTSISSHEESNCSLIAVYNKKEV
jgi:hypothetical protein